MSIVWAWAGFIVIIGVVLALDLGVLNRHAHVVKMREALAFTAFTIVLASIFAGVVYFAYDAHWFGLGLTADPLDRVVNDGRLAAVKFFTGYVIELTLSMDNVFVMALIFQHLRIPPLYQHRVLFWGILGALFMRGAMIGVGASLVAKYSWVLYIFGAFLVITAIRMLRSRDHQDVPKESAVISFLRTHFRVTDNYDGHHFLTRIDLKSYLTPLGVALVLVETTDLIFAVDSIPAIFAITADPFLVFTSNVFAIICLRSLYFALAGLIEKFHYLKVSLSLILGLVGVKMLVGHPLKEVVGPALNFWLLGVVMAILLGGALASVVWVRKEARTSRP